MARYWGPVAAPTSARVDIVTPSNATWEDGFQFDPPAVTGAAPPPYYPPGSLTGPTWGFSGQNFRMDIKTNINASGPSLTLTGPNGTIGQFVVDDPVNRILHANVPESVLAALVPGSYIYDFIMFDNSSPPIRVQLMHGYFTVSPGITGG